MTRSEQERISAVCKLYVRVDSFIMFCLGGKYTVHRGCDTLTISDVACDICSTPANTEAVHRTNTTSDLETGWYRCYV